MADNKKYYYMRLKEDFFESETMILLESMQDGYLYSNILLKMYLKSLKFNGNLLLKEFIPYNNEMIATITRHQVGTVEKALNIFKELGLIEVLDNGSIYMLEIQNYIGSSNTEADRKRAYRKRIENEKGQMSLKCPPEIRDKSLDIRDKEIILKDNTYYAVTDEEIAQFSMLYPYVDINQEIKNMIGWCLSNPDKRKTKKGIHRFINGWLSKANKECKEKKGVNIHDEIPLI